MTDMPTAKQILEAVLFASDVPVGLQVLTEVLGDRSVQEVRALLAEMAEAYERGERGIILHEIAGGFQILSRKECSPWVERMLRSRRKIRLSKPALESLAIVAYRQPITKVEIDSIRGVDTAGVLHTLLERNLVTIKGRSKGVGRPLLYTTTPEFLSYMGINDLSDLPELKEVAPLLEEREQQPEQGEAVSAGAATTEEQATKSEVEV
ncbi:MAG: SMC-Scp complex subunit ScpB [Candidatus Eisenbacteria bacterium]|uniref:SMC-Scp complex subunit ScpB n=1 Tax=Eiseniibacteriota bacterium TaxID=2212470 RepID=A0A538T646_UNCEI|nr:MAG: SMC-Scp complex subunit ScpB [Candidatus Eisenbacteria bacterium]